MPRKPIVIPPIPEAKGMSFNQFLSHIIKGKASEKLNNSVYSRGRMPEGIEGLYKLTDDGHIKRTEKD